MTALKVAPPPDIAATLPPTEVLRQAVAGADFALAPGTRIRRAVTHPAAVIPPYVERTYRFGPPGAFANEEGRFAKYWMYAAQDLETALWESGFCTNDLTQPGTFYIPRHAILHGLIATFTLKTDARLLDLDGTALSKLGIYDRIHGDHAWCQWFGLRLFDILDQWPGDNPPLGFRYPSRKHKNHSAIAVHSGALEAWRSNVEIEVTRFSGMAEFATIRSDPNYAAPFETDLSPE